MLGLVREVRKGKRHDRRDTLGRLSSTAPMRREDLSNPPEETIVLEFNGCINRRDLEGLAALMADEHTFIDSVDQELVGKSACLSAWDAFFRQFPDYRNIFEKVRTRDGRVVILGYAECSDARLHGPTLWSAVVKGGRVAEWRVLEDTPANRLSLGLCD